MNENLSYRLLPQTVPDWMRLRKFFEGTRGFIPPIQLGMAAVAETGEGEIVAGAILQMVSYLGPFKIDSRWTGKVDYAKLKAEVDSVYQKNPQKALIIAGYVAMTTDEAVARLAESAGMIRQHGTILLVQEFNDQHAFVE